MVTPQMTQETMSMLPPNNLDDRIHEALNEVTIISGNLQLFQRRYARLSTTSVGTSMNDLLIIYASCQNLAQQLQHIHAVQRHDVSRLVQAEERLDEIRRLLEEASPDLAALRMVAARSN
jgi:hypothetical protein